MAARQYVYVDESGTHSESPYDLVAAYRGSPRQWARFSAKWSGVLKSNGVEEFHANVFFNRKRIKDPKKNPYRKWSDQKADNFIGNLLKVLLGSKIQSVGCSVERADFDALSYGERCVLVGYETQKSRRKTRQPAPIHLASRVMFSRAVNGVSPETKVHFIVAHNDYDQRTLDVFGALKQQGTSGREHQLQDIAFGFPIDHPGLQAADLFAYVWFTSWVRTQFERRSLSPSKLSLLKLISRRDPDIPHMDATEIEAFLVRLGRIGEKRRRLQAVKEP